MESKCVCFSFLYLCVCLSLSLCLSLAVWNLSSDVSACSREDFDMEEKARFGELCCEENSKGREWFAKYVNAQVNMTLG